MSLRILASYFFVLSDQYSKSIDIIDAEAQRRMSDVFLQSISAINKELTASMRIKEAPFTLIVGKVCL